MEIAKQAWVGRQDIKSKHKKENLQIDQDQKIESFSEIG